MKVSVVRHWVGDAIPEKYSKREGPFEISMEDIESLYKDFDVAIFHSRPIGKETEDYVSIYLDRKYKHFRQR